MHASDAHLEQAAASARDMVAVERAMREAEVLRLPDAVLLAAAHADREASLSAQAEDGSLLDWLSVSTGASWRLWNALANIDALFCALQICES